MVNFLVHCLVPGVWYNAWCLVHCLIPCLVLSGHGELPGALPGAWYNAWAWCRSICWCFYFCKTLGPGNDLVPVHILLNQHFLEGDAAHEQDPVCQQEPGEWGQGPGVDPVGQPALVVGPIVKVEVDLIVVLVVAP